MTFKKGDLVSYVWGKKPMFGIVVNPTYLDPRQNTESILVRWFAPHNGEIVDLPSDGVLLSPVRASE